MAANPIFRLIPARAGKTHQEAVGRRGSGAHPRAGGENPPRASAKVTTSGSSPRGRGKLGGDKLVGVLPRLIPARAGKTRSRAKPSSEYRAHPRAGGENPLTLRIDSTRAGSSPRGRGKPALGGLTGLSTGLIPARAGKTPSMGALADSARAHPRAGGENPGDPLSNFGQRGSSPRGRGKRARRAHGHRRRRLIPARAGKTLPFLRSYRTRPAHPRAGGENNIEETTGALSAGSSPRGRGKLQVEANGADRLRLIPARAGKTTSPAPPASPDSAHPRAGGENKVEGLVGVADLGSSPRGRGKPLDARPHAVNEGLIPARAGKTSGGAARP